MKRREVQELKTRPPAELEKKFEEFRSSLWSLKKDLAAGKVKNVREIKALKKNIARVLTFLKK